MAHSMVGTGTRVRLTRGERRRQLLDAAHRVFVTRGYHQSLMDDIAESAQVSKPVLYQHFASKYELYLALLDEQLQELTALLQEALEAPTAKERVHNTVVAYFGFIAREDRAHRLIFENDLLHDERIAERIERFHDEYAQAIGAVISADTNLSIAESVMLGHALAAVAQASARNWLATGGIDQQRAIDSTTRLAWRGIGGFQRKADATPNSSAATHADLD